MIITGAQACQLFMPISIPFWASIITLIIIGWMFLDHLKSNYFIKICAIILFIYCLLTTFKFNLSHFISTSNHSLSIVA